jgi:hypothetical protein
MKSKGFLLSGGHIDNTHCLQSVCLYSQGLTLQSSFLTKGYMAILSKVPRGHITTPSTTN